MAERRTLRRARYVRALREAGAWFPLFGLWVSGLVALVVLTSTASEAEQDAVSFAGPAVTAVGSRTDDGRRDVAVRVRYADPVTVRTQVAGLVTALGVQPGSALATGAVLAKVDGVNIRIFTGRAPLFRDVGRGDAGPDVEDVARFLAETGHLDSDRVAPRAGAAVESAVRAWDSRQTTSPRGT